MDPVRGAQSRINARVWSERNYLQDYKKSGLRPPEAGLFTRFHDRLGGRVLELGCGAGRVTRSLVGLAASVEAIDISSTMVSYCRDTIPQADFSVGDLSDLSAYETGAFAAVVASFCVLDVLDDDERRHTLRESARLLSDDGILIASSHNVAYVPRIAKPTRIISRSPLRIVQNLVRMPLRMRNRARLLPMERVERDYSIHVDEAHDYTLLHYYISRDAQERQLRELGFELEECLDLQGTPVAAGEMRPGCPELYYAARPARGGAGPGDLAIGDQLAGDERGGGLSPRNSAAGTSSAHHS